MKYLILLFSIIYLVGCLEEEEKPKPKSEDFDAKSFVEDTQKLLGEIDNQEKKKDSFSLTKVADEAPGGGKKKFSLTPVADAGETTKKPNHFVKSALDLEMIWCPPGTFLMGSPKSEEGRSVGHHVGEYIALLKESEQDSFEFQHKVTLSGFYMGKYEVTQREFIAIMGNNPSIHVGMMRPVDNLSWRSVKEGFLKKLNQIEEKSGRLPSGWKYDLPTEAQWEYACRAGTTTPFWWGHDPEYNGRTFFAETNSSDVGLHPPNPWGFHDLQGNVWEMTANYFGPYSKEHVFDPTGPDKPFALPMGPIVAGRGISWESGAGRSALRGTSPTWTYAPGWGFRIALYRDT